MRGITSGKGVESANANHSIRWRSPGDNLDRETACRGGKISCAGTPVARRDTGVIGCSKLQMYVPHVRMRRAGGGGSLLICALGVICCIRHRHPPSW